jgi:hypothetical protein
MIDFDTTPQATRIPARAPQAPRIHTGPTGPKLADPRPPTPPVAPVLLAQPRAHRVVAWRHDGGMRDTTHGTLESAREALRALHWAIYWKACILCGRETIERHAIQAPPPSAAELAEFEALEAHARHTRTSHL